METNNLIDSDNKRNRVYKFKKKISDVYSSYFLTYKSLPVYNITVFWTAVFIGLIFLILSLNSLSDRFLITIPSYGGTWNEGVVGIPRYINPVLANSEADKDLTTLVYSGILKKDVNGNLINDLASNVEESEDHLSFTITLNDKAKFQDGKKVTADDIIFTISKIGDKDINSPLAINFEGIDVEKIDDSTVIFHLKKPYMYFKENLTFGILPKHIWSNLSNEEFSLSIYNTEPIGSGPYKINKVVRNTNNLPTKYILKEYKDYILGRPFIDNINIYIYKNNNELISALNYGDINATNYLDQSYFSKVKNTNKEIISSSLSNLFSISFNPSKNPSLVSANTRTALNLLINKQEIINQIFFGYARETDSLFSNNLDLGTSSISNIDQAKKLLTKTITTIGKDKKKQTQTVDINQNLEINLATADIDDLKKVADKIKEDWAKLGITVNIKVYSLSDISDIIKKRDFEALLFGSIINHDTDLYAYWHSSQRVYPGLNITGYTSKNLDKNLEIIKNSLDESERNKALNSINEELNEESPAIPIYSNNSNYLVIKNSANIENFIPATMKESSERFLDVRDWYIYKERVWKISYIKTLTEKLQNIIH
ncbi:MAG: peptide/nickel transport system substrate-binding protein [Patescibacteria group bacterium]|nr:peptide/nickel transport system substrate-binding protein [Patescibacteria group bacterium]